MVFFLAKLAIFAASTAKRREYLMQTMCRPFFTKVQWRIHDNLTCNIVSKNAFDDWIKEEDKDTLVWAGFETIKIPMARSKNSWIWKMRQKKFRLQRFGDRASTMALLARFRTVSSLIIQGRYICDWYEYFQNNSKSQM